MSETRPLAATPTPDPLSTQPRLLSEAEVSRLLDAAWNVWADEQGQMAETSEWDLFLALKVSGQDLTDQPLAARFAWRWADRHVRATEQAADQKQQAMHTPVGPLDIPGPTSGER